MLLTVDSSVIVAGIIKKEESHSICKDLMTKIAKAEHTAAIPYSVLVEVVASLKRRTGSEYIAENAEKELKNIDAVQFFELSKERAEESATIAIKTGLRGMDAIVVQVAKENNATLITIDKVMADLAKGIVAISSAKDVLENKEDENNSELHGNKYKKEM